MEATIILLFVVLSAVVALVFFIVFRKKPNSGPDDAASSYAEGLNLLLAGNKEEALQKLRETVSQESNNIDAYVKIGDILRELGQVERAINVHKYLTVRKGVSPKQQHDILRGLARDYQAGDNFEKALGVLNKVLADDRSCSWAQEMKLSLYEAKEDWSHAFQVFKEISPKNGKVKSSRLAVYRVQEGIQLQQEGRDKEAKSRFKDAIKICSEGPPGYIYLAEAYKNEDRKSDALGVLKQFVEKVPEQSYLAFEQLKELLYEGGVYGEIENLYLDVIEKQPDNLMARLGLAEIYEKKGELEAAIDTCQQVLDKDPESKEGRKHLVRLYHKAGKDAEALDIALDLIDKSLKPKASTFDLSNFFELWPTK